MTLSRRHFLCLVGAAGSAFGLELLQSRNVLAESLLPNPMLEPVASTWLAQAKVEGPFSLPPLPYAYDALEPHIDTMTMQIHHDRHHAAYVNNLNAAIAKYPQLASKTAEDLVKDLASLPEDIRTAVRNNAGGHINHSMFWQIMGPKAGGEPKGEIAAAINTSFGSFAEFKQKFNQAGAKQFGSGWAWLVKDASGKLLVTGTANQDSPLMNGQIPIMGNDVWEHAYYLKYQNKRADYLAAWWNVVNWQEINRRFTKA
ncbi:MAG: superoxide dismutase [Aphanocapsa sp. GSE-SYN-MK-11-07L]|jgi:Fe-Mn family superoxide dismutase|nr:superoxide dismutase [Aphanocapsa sp. GSE-SYN-MK-11-07L]